MFLAGFLADRSRRINELVVPLSAIGLAALPILLVFAEPDFGTAAVYVAALGAVLFIVGMRWAHLIAIGTSSLVVLLAVLWWLPAAGVNVLKPYQTARLTGFTHPGTDPAGVNYNTEQSVIAVGAGGLRGRGVEGATQTRLDFTPANDTDFAFASLAEQRGFLGASFLLCSTCSSSGVGLKIVTNARDLFSAALAGGLVFAFLFQVFVNVGMAIGIAPITGIPLPFVSVGGSSMITNLAGDWDPPGDHTCAAAGGATREQRRARAALGALGAPRAAGRAQRPGRSSSRGARELVPLLARELRAGGDLAAVREGGPLEGAAALVWIGAADEEVLHAASRARASRSSR